MKKAPSVLFVLVLATAVYGASITVTKPASVDTWIKGQTYAITWTKTGDMPNTVKISLMEKNSVAVVREIADGVANTGAYLWLVPSDIAFGEYRVRVLVKTTPILDDSDTFSIVVMSVSQGTATAKQKTTVKAQRAEAIESCSNCDRYVRKAQIKNWGNALVIGDWILHDIYSARPTGYPPGAGVNEYAHVGYDYFSYPGTYGTGWTTFCRRSSVWVNMGEFQSLIAIGNKLVAASLHLRQVSSLIVGDNCSSCGSGFFVFLAPWTDFYNFQVTIGEPTAGLETWKTDYWIDITDIVMKWLDGTWANCGLLLNSNEVDWGHQSKTCYSAFDVSLVLMFKNNSK